MSFNTDIIDKIVQYKSVSKRKKIDRLLEIESNYIANNIGINISKSEKNNIKKNNAKIHIIRFRSSSNNFFLNLFMVKIIRTI